MTAAAARGVPVLPLVPQVLEERRIAAASYEPYYRERYAARPLRKAAFFVRSDGLAAAWRKARSKRIERRLQRAQEIVLAKVAVEGTTLVGVTRFLGGPLRFPVELLFEPGPDRGLGAVELGSRARALVESYLPVPACAVPPGLADAIAADNPWLRPWHPEAAAEWIEVPGAQAPAESAPPTGARRANPGRDVGGVFLLGFGAYVRDQVLHHFRGRVRAAVDHRAALLRQHVRTPFPLLDSVDDVLADIAAASRPLVIVATYHSDHAPLALRVLDANSSARVFVEKPAAVTTADAERLAARALAGAWIDVGYNRRWAPLTHVLAAECARLPRPLTLSLTVQELPLPPSHWYFWPNQGTRLTGNSCHWLDLLHYLLGGPPVELALTAAGADTVCLTARWGDGSLASLVATDRGSALEGVTERIEIRGGATTLVLDDYRRLDVRDPAGTRTWRGRHRDKGHDAMYRDVRRRWLAGELPRYPAGDILPVARVVATAATMLTTGERTRRLTRAESGA